MILPTSPSANRLRRVDETALAIDERRVLDSELRGLDRQRMHIVPSFDGQSDVPGGVRLSAQATRSDAGTSPDPAAH